MRRIAALAVAVCLILPGVAFAQSSSQCQAYNNETCTTVTTSGNSSGTLPFTGLDVFLLAGGGLTLLGTGFVVRRVSRRLN